MPAEIQFTSLLFIYVLSGAVTIGLTLYGLRSLQRDGLNPTTVAFVGIVLSVSIWTVARFFELLFVSELLSRFWLSVIYVGYGGAGLSTLYFGLAFTGKHEYLTRRVVAATLVLPALAVVVAATNPMHELFWTGEFVPKEGWWGEMWILDRSFQPAFHAYMVYVVGAALIGLFTLLREAIESPDVYRYQTIAFAVGSLSGITMGVLFGMEAQPFVPTFVDLVPVGWAAMGLFFGYAIFEYRMLDLVPVARDTVIDSMQDGYVVLDTDDRIVDLNDAALQVFDADTDVVGTTLTETFPPCREVLEAHDNGTQIEREIEVEIDGDQRVFVASISTLREDDRRIGRLLFIRDITERRAVQRRYQALIENSTDLIFIMDPDSEISYASPSLEQITGVPPEEIIGEKAVDYIHHEDRDTVLDTFEDLLEEPGEKRRIEYRLPDERGNWLYLEGDVWNLLDNPFVEGIVTNAREITARKERERELREMNDQLEEANQQLEQFATVISHDLRNPINVAKGHTELARETGNEEHFTKIDDSLDRMETIIEDVLALSRQGDEIGDTEAVNIERVAKEAWEHVDTANATITIEGDTSFEADRDRLLQLFENCFRNAIEHGGSDVTVRVGTDNGCFYVEDDGKGIPPEEREAVFESGHTSNTNGTGLGLAIVQGIADAHGWTVRAVEGEKGGARFEFVGIGQLESAD